MRASQLIRAHFRIHTFDLFQGFSSYYSSNAWPRWLTPSIAEESLSIGDSCHMPLSCS